MPDTDIWIEQVADSPLMATAIHAGHEIRRELLPLLVLDDAGRAHEEDPYTDYLARVVPTWLVPQRSRFEVDLNRPRDAAVYTRPEMAWGLPLWKAPLAEDMIERSLHEYDAFYTELKKLLDRLVVHFGHIVVLDLHAYNYRRAGPGQPQADPASNPEVNVGTGTMPDRERCLPVIRRFITDLHNYNFMDRHLDVRENINFQGRQLAQWIHHHYPDSICVLSIEFKKFYMDEWTGVVDIEQIQAIRDALQTTLEGVLEELKNIK
ncbi:N-formylglutamate amidohydrolase [Sulfuriflexus sp.]|uniref:N-formylglutamate amidohydrolase n=1 Tax=Sulfuriflexus sp. TaxID=2015443 RepID=UPI0028CEF4AA|nr:N-formylglutamate amidohydrolase [Sulfuriflexus sp.]MDT8405462.1 N-formylglutamate amidohydrolase [Sulfuriflexus sp.]